MSKREEKIHPTTDQKKVAVLHSKKHKPAKNDITINQSKSKMRRVSKILSKAAKFATDPLNIGYEKFKHDLALSPEEINTLDKINKAIENNFEDIYKLIPKFKNDEITQPFNAIVSLQKEYFKRLHGLKFDSTTLDADIETISNEYETKFAIIINSHINKLSAGDVVNINSLHTLLDLNKNTIKAFKENTQTLKDARYLTKTAYTTALTITACMCLGAIALTFGVLLVTSPGLVIISTATFVGGILLVDFGAAVVLTSIISGVCHGVRSVTTAPKLTKQHLAERKNLFDELQLSLFQTCTSLRNCITANEPKLKAG